MKDDLEELKNTQSHSECSPSKQMSHPEPMVEENTIEVDSNLDSSLNHETSQHTPVVEEELPYKDHATIFIPISIVETNEPIIDESM